MSKIIAKRVSNYELFYDLVFVLTTSSLVNLLHNEGVTIRSILSFIAGNLIISSLWINETFYLNRFGEQDLLDILTIIPSMFVIGQLGLHFSMDFKSHALPFNFFSFLSYIIILLQYILRGRKIGFNTKIRQSILYTASLVISFLMATIATLFHYWTYDAWSLIVYFIPFIFPFLVRPKGFFKNSASLNFPHAVERVQLITIITFGEAVIAILKSFQGHQLLTGIPFFIGMAFLFVYYISHTHLNLNHHQIADTLLLFYAHTFLILALNFFTVGLELLPSHHAGFGLAFFLIGIFLFYLSLLSLTPYYKVEFLINKREKLEYTFYLVVGSILLFFFREQLFLFGLFFVLMTYRMISLTFRQKK
ncbi:low temperature requirement protein A [Streptococcus marmotae]|uniref:low temperature requirement protein A n=1 Tax=Streptococcus marmotae TaxID=1825069 RepID=UPI00082E136C|nr:low temperature requirement protein A [Streptococcus marmotae]